MSDYGYIRVSTKEQNEGRQLLAMKELGIPKKNLYIDKQSGKNFDRPAYKRMVHRLKPGDVLYIKSIDRLGRDYEEIQNQWRILTREKGIDIVVLDMPLLDTRRGKDLLGTFVSDMVLQVLSFVAESERTNIKQRQAEGIAAAKLRGVQFGRPSNPLPDEFDKAVHLWATGELTCRQAAAACGMTPGNFRHHAQKVRNKMDREILEKLKPCPFCGEKKCVTIAYSMSLNEPRYYLRCWRCYSCGPIKNAKKEAVEAWARRAGNCGEEN